MPILKNRWAEHFAEKAREFAKKTLKVNGQEIVTGSNNNLSFNGKPTHIIPSPLQTPSREQFDHIRCYRCIESINFFLKTSNNLHLAPQPFKIKSSHEYASPQIYLNWTYDKSFEDIVTDDIDILN